VRGAPSFDPRQAFGAPPHRFQAGNSGSTKAGVGSAHPPFRTHLGRRGGHPPWIPGRRLGHSRSIPDRSRQKRGEHSPSMPHPPRQALEPLSFDPRQAVGALYLCPRPIEAGGVRPSLDPRRVFWGALLQSMRCLGALMQTGRVFWDSAADQRRKNRAPMSTGVTCWGRTRGAARGSEVH